jgi:hypothetical protein
MAKKAEGMNARPPAEQAVDGSEHNEFDGVAFETIEAAVRETERGRWFLQEYARRVRAQELARIEAAIWRIEQRLPSASDSAPQPEPRILALSVHQRLLDLAASLRERGVDDDACTRIEAQANALIDLVRRRNLVAAAEMLEKGLASPQAAPAA